MGVGARRFSARPASLSGPAAHRRMLGRGGGQVARAAVRPLPVRIPMARRHRHRPPAGRGRCVGRGVACRAADRGPPAPGQRTGPGGRCRGVAAGWLGRPVSGVSHPMGRASTHSGAGAPRLAAGLADRSGPGLRTLGRRPALGLGVHHCHRIGARRSARHLAVRRCLRLACTAARKLDARPAAARPHRPRVLCGGLPGRDPAGRPADRARGTGRSRPGAWTRMVGHSASHRAAPGRSRHAAPPLSATQSDC